MFRRCLISLILLGLCAIRPALASDCCPNRRSSEGEIALRPDYIELAVADREAALELWRDVLGFTVSEFEHEPGGLERALIPFADGTSIQLVYSAQALDAKVEYYRKLCAAGGGPACAVFSGTALEHIRFALDSVEQEADFHDARTRYLLSLPLDGSAQPLRFVEYLLPESASQSATLHANAAFSLRDIWLATDDLPRDLLLLELLGGTEQPEERTAAGLATVVEMAAGRVLLHRGRACGLIGLTISRGGEYEALPMHSPQETGGLWLHFVDEVAAPE